MRNRRDNCEIEDGMGFAGLVPTADEKRAERHREADRLILESHRIRIAKLEAALTAESQRREAAEAVVDFILRRPLVYDKTSVWDMSVEHRAKYPKEPAKDSDLLDIPAFLRRGDD